MDDGDFGGHCEFHGDACIEGVARLSALAARANVTMAQLPELPDEHRVWDLAAYYIGACVCVPFWFLPLLTVFQRNCA